MNLLEPTVSRRRCRSVVVLGGRERTRDRPARTLAESLRGLGVEVVYLGRENSASRIAAVSAERGADTVEICLERTGGVPLLRELLRELTQLGCRDVSIVVHRVE